MFLLLKEKGWVWGCWHQRILWLLGSWKTVSSTRQKRNQARGGLSANNRKHICNFVLVWWFREQLRPFPKGFSSLAVYADDFVACFQYEEEAHECFRHLRKRMMHFGLELEESKDRHIEFGWFAADNRCRRGEEKTETFTFLGFMHLLFQRRNGKFRVKGKTNRKKFAKKCKEKNLKIKDMRTWDLNRIFRHRNRMLVCWIPPFLHRSFKILWIVRQI